MKKGAIETEQLIKIILLILAGIIIGGIVMIGVKQMGSDNLQEYMCWATNGIKSSNFIYKANLESTCEMFFKDEPMDMPGLAKLMTDMWWMYGKGNWDFNFVSKHEIAIAAFEVGTEIKYSDLLYYLATHKDGAEVTDVSGSDYNYIEKGSEGPTICWGKKVAEGYTEPKLVPGRTYYLVYWDDVSVAGQGKEFGDKIVIAGKPQKSQEGDYYCKSRVPGEKTLVIGNPQSAVGQVLDYVRSWA